MLFSATDFLMHFPMVWLESTIFIGLLIFLVSLLLEDAAILLGIYFLTAANPVPFAVIFTILVLSLTIGDVGLYGLGRWLNKTAYIAKIRQRAAFNKASVLLANNAFSAILISRIIPGLRLPTYVAAGLTHMPLLLFATIVFAACVAWVGLILFFGPTLLMLLVAKTGWSQINLILLGIVLILGLQFFSKKLSTKRA